jgi:hypothetical protein
VTSDQRGVTPGHRLLPPERWFASFILERQRTNRTPAITRLEENYGPEGIALGAAAILSGLAGAVIGCVGLVLLFASGGHGPTLHPGYYLLFIAIVLECPAIIRAIQGIYAGRRFRGDRPFVKHP